MIEQASDLAKQSDSTIIVLLVVLVILAIASIPVINTLEKVRKGRRAEKHVREDRLLKVIEGNTEVNSALKTLIEADQKHCDECKSEQRALFRKMFDNQEIANMKLTEIAQKLE